MEKSPYKLFGLPAVAAITLGYLLLGLVWIAVSDKALASSVRDPGFQAVIQTYKGCLFVVISALLLYILLRRASERICKMHEQVAENDELLRLLYDQAEDGVVLLQEDLSIVKCNDGMCHLLGVNSKEELIGKSLADFTPERQSDGQLSSEKAEELFKQLKGNEPQRFPWRHVKSSGTIVDVEVSCRRRRIGDLDFLQAIVRDVTERVQLAEHLEREVKQKQLLLDLHDKAQEMGEQELYDLTLDQSVSLTDSDVGFLHLVSEDQKIIELASWKDEALKGCENVSSTHVPLDEVGSLVECMRQSRPVIYNEYPISPKNNGLPEGHTPLHRIMSIPVLVDGRIRMIVVVGNKAGEYVGEDVLQVQLVAHELQETMQQRRLTAELTNREAVLSEAQQIARIGSWSLDLASGVMEWSAETYRIFGIKSETRTPTFETFLEAVYPDDRDMVRKTYDESMKNKTFYGLEHRIVHKDGSIRHVYSRGRTHFADDGAPVRSIGTVQDITARKQAEESLQRSERKYRSLFENMVTGFTLHEAIYDDSGMAVDYRFLEVNPAFESLTNLKAVEVVGRCLSEVFPHNDPYWRDLYGDVARTGEPVSIERHSTELDRYYELWAFSPRQGQFATIFLETTKRKKAEEDLRKARLQLQCIIDNTHDIIFQIDLKGNYIFGNAAAEEVTGYSLNELLKMNIMRLIAPEYHAMVEERLHTRIAGMLPNDSTFGFELIRKDGHRIWVELTTKGVYDADGKLEAIQGVARDITERKHMQKMLEKRVAALTQPIEELGDFEIEDIFDIEELQRIQDEFSSATGVAAVIANPDGTPITKPSNVTRFCYYIIRSTEMGCARCIKSDALLGRQNPEGPVVRPCLSAGLWDAGASITVGGKHVANWLIGQVRDETQTEEKMRAYAREIGADEEEFLKAFREVPIMRKERFQKVAQALFSLANQLSNSAYMNLQQSRFIAREKKRTEELLRLSTAIDQAAEEVVITDAEGVVEYVNPAFEATTGYSRLEAIGKKPRFLERNPQEEELYMEIWDRLSAGQSWKGHIHNKRKDGTIYIEESTISPVHDATGAIVNYVAVNRDITREQNLEQQFRHSQKMEAVGRLAGGVAHDLNNILQTILGFCNVLLMETERQEAIKSDVVEIQNAAKRGGKLTRQLLTFSRKQPTELTELDINEVLEHARKMLDRLLGEGFQLVLKAVEKPWPIKADSGQIEQIVMNLVVNARDAMPDGGSIVLRTENIELKEGDAAESKPKARAGRFVCLSVVDKGTGMAEDIIEHMFEPFFTTKPLGAGTGLGLAVIYGIVEQHFGWIDVESEVGKGSVFKVYLPVIGAVAKREGEEVGEHPEAERRERILFVEDDPTVCNLVTHILENQGYVVVPANSSAQALEYFTRDEERFDLLLSDVILPGRMTGTKLASALLEKKPDLPVILFSGYSDERVRIEEIREKEFSYLKKPFHPLTLVGTVERALMKLGNE